MDSLELSDEERFVSLFVRHQAAIHSFIMTMLPSLEESEEVLQESSMTMWKKFDQFEPDTNFRSWAFQIAKFTTFNYVRKMGRDRHHFNENMMKLVADYAEERSEELEQQRRILRQCITRLPKQDVEVMKGCYEEQATIKSYARQVDRTANAVTKQLSRIRRSLLKCVRRTLALEGLS